MVRDPELDLQGSADGLGGREFFPARAGGVLDRVVAGLGQAELAGKEFLVGHALLGEKAAHHGGRGARGTGVGQEGKPERRGMVGLRGGEHGEEGGGERGAVDQWTSGPVDRWTGGPVDGRRMAEAEAEVGVPVNR